MPQYIAFLRAINVGGHTVKMDYLRTLFAALDFAQVATFIASGNVLFETRETDTAALERRIEQQLRAALGYEVATFLRTPTEVAAVAAHQPFPAPQSDTSEALLSVGFLRAAPPDSAQKLARFQAPTDMLCVHNRELYWRRHGRISDSTITGAALEKALGAPMTMRNITTVRRLAAKYPHQG